MREEVLFRSIEQVTFTSSEYSTEATTELYCRYRHENWCLRSKKKRKPFDSARARAKGTDLEFFFPTFHLDRSQDQRRTEMHWRVQSVFPKYDLLFVRFWLVSISGDSFRKILRKWNKHSNRNPAYRNIKIRPKTAAAGIRLGEPVSPTEDAVFTAAAEANIPMRQNQINVIMGISTPIFQGRLRPSSCPGGFRASRNMNSAQSAKLQVEVVRPTYACLSFGGKSLATTEHRPDLLMKASPVRRSGDKDRKSNFKNNGMSGSKASTSFGINEPWLKPCTHDKKLLRNCGYKAKSKYQVRT